MFFWPLKVFVFRMYCNQEDIFLVRFPSNYHLIIMQDCNYRLHLSMNETVVRHIWILYPAKNIWLHLINSKILSTYLFIMASSHLFPYFISDIFTHIHISSFKECYRKPNACFPNNWIYSKYSLKFSIIFMYFLRISWEKGR